MSRPPSACVLSTRTISLVLALVLFAEPAAVRAQGRAPSALSFAWAANQGGTGFAGAGNDSGPSLVPAAAVLPAQPRSKRPLWQRAPLMVAGTTLAVGVIEGLLAGMSAPAYMKDGATILTVWNGMNALIAPIGVRTEAGAYCAIAGFAALAVYDATLRKATKPQLFWRNLAGLNGVTTAVGITESIAMHQAAARERTAGPPRLEVGGFHISAPPGARWQLDGSLTRREPGTYAYVHRFDAGGQALTLKIRALRADTSVAAVGDLAAWTRRSIARSATPPPADLEVKEDSIKGQACVQASWSSRVQGRDLMIRSREILFASPAAPDQVLLIQWAWVLDPWAQPCTLLPEDYALLGTWTIGDGR